MSQARALVTGAVYDHKTVKMLARAFSMRHGHRSLPISAASLPSRRHVSNLRTSSSTWRRKANAIVSSERRARFELCAWTCRKFRALDAHLRGCIIQHTYGFGLALAKAGANYFRDRNGKSVSASALARSRNVRSSTVPILRMSRFVSNKRACERLATASRSSTFPRGK
jgi:hypothetical protein